MHAQVRDGRGRKVLLQRLPLPAVLERHEEAELGASVEQALALRILADDARGVIVGNAVHAIGQLRPGRAVVIGLVDVRLQIVVAQEAIHRDVRRPLAMRRRLDVLDAPARRQVLRRDVLPRLAVVAGHVDGPVVGADPEHAALELRLAHRVDRRVDLLARDVARDRVARHDLVLLLVCRQVRADHLPRHAVVHRPVKHVRRLVDDFRVVRRHHDDGLPREAVLDLVGMVAVAVLGIDPPALRLARLDVEPLDFSLARAPDDLPVGRRPDAAGLAARRLRPRLRRVIEAERHGRHARHHQRRVVLLRAVEVVRMPLVDADHVDLGRRLVQDARPRASAVRRDVRAAVVALDRVERVIGIEPDAVVVAVRRRDGRERLAAVRGLEQPERVHPDFFGVFRVHVHVVEVERTRAQVRRAVDQLPGRTGIVRAIQAALRARRLDHGVDGRRAAARDVDVDLADQHAREARRELLPGVSAVGRLVDAALGRGTAADDVPALAEAAIHPGVELVGVRVVDREHAAAGRVVHEQRLLPRLAAVGRLEDAALVVGPERRAERREPHDVGIGGVNDDRADLPASFRPMNCQVFPASVDL